MVQNIIPNNNTSKKEVYLNYFFTLLTTLALAWILFLLYQSLFVKDLSSIFAGLYLIFTVPIYLLLGLVILIVFKKIHGLFIILFALPAILLLVRNTLF
jgi:hypothetical protein